MLLRGLGEGGALDGKLLSDVLAVFLRVVRGWYCRQAKAAGYKDVRVGSVTFCQRFGGAININPHFHVLQLDGVYTDDEGKETPVFVPAPALEDADAEWRHSSSRLYLCSSTNYVRYALQSCSQGWPTRGHGRSGRRPRSFGTAVQIRRPTTARSRTTDSGFR